MLDRRRRIVASRASVHVLLLSAVLAAIPAAPSAATTETRRGKPNCAQPIPEVVTPPTVEVELTLSSTKVDVGDPIRFEVTVRNNGPIPIPYRHGGLTHDFWVRDDHGLIWLWSQGKAYTNQLEQDYLWPGESRSGRTRWGSVCAADGRDLRPGLPGPGRYVGRALWVSEAGDEDGAWWSNEVSFRITR